MIAASADAISRLILLSLVLGGVLIVSLAWRWSMGYVRPREDLTSQSNARVKKEYARIAESEPEKIVDGSQSWNA